MERIIVEWYKHEDNTTGKTEIIAFSLQEAISMVRQTNDFKVICLGAEYKDKEALIRLVSQLNGETPAYKLEINPLTIVNNYGAIKDELAKKERDFKQQMLNSLTELDFENLVVEQVDNVEAFVRTFAADIMVEYLLKVLNLPVKPGRSSFIKRFRETLSELK